MKKVFLVAICLVLTLAFFSCIGEQEIPDRIPPIEISEDGYWVIDGEKTVVKANPTDDVTSNKNGRYVCRQCG